MDSDRFFTIVCSIALALTALVFVAVKVAPSWHLARLDGEPPLAAAAVVTATAATEGAVEPAVAVSDGAPATGPRGGPPSPEVIAAAQVHRLPAADAEVLERLVGTVDAIAAGASPELAGASLPTMAEVLVRVDRDGRTVVAAGTKRRYGEVVDALTALEPASAVAAFRALEGDLERVYRQHGSGDGTFEERLRQAVDHLLAVELPEVDPDVVSAGVRWAFSDPGLRRLSPAQQHLLLMGRSPAVKVQARLCEVRAAFGWPEPAPLAAPIPELDEGVRPVMTAESGGHRDRDATAAIESPSSVLAEAVEVAEP